MSPRPMSACTHQSKVIIFCSDINKVIRYKAKAKASSCKANTKAMVLGFKIKTKAMAVASPGFGARRARN